MLAKSPEREGKREPGSSEGSQQILSEIWLMKSEINDLKGRVHAQSGQAAKPNWDRSPKEAIEMVNSQRDHIGVVKVVKSVEEEKNVTIVSLVVSLNI